jgi:hypothetical protein
MCQFHPNAAFACLLREKKNKKRMRNAGVYALPETNRRGSLVGAVMMLLPPKKHELEGYQ